MGETLLDRAFRNYEAAKYNYKNIGVDDFYLNLAGYLLQQSVELYLKHYLELRGVSYPFTHDISVLLNLLDKNKVELPISTDVLDNLFDMAGTITLWESKTRYIKDFFLVQRQLDRAFRLLDNLFPIENNALELFN